MLCSVLATALAFHVPDPLPPVSGDLMWEEKPYVQMKAGYHPLLRFNCWNILRFNRSTTYEFLTPGFIQQGQYVVQDGQYGFRAVMANDLENSDIANLLSDMGGDERKMLSEKYAASMSNFNAAYIPSENLLKVTYAINGKAAIFELYPVNDGESQLTTTIPDSDRVAAGLWQTSDHFPDRLDARTRNKIGGLDGLRQFAKEAGASETGLLTVLDLRVDGTYRLHGDQGRWNKRGSTVTLVSGLKEIRFTLSDDGQKLLAQGKPVFVRS